MEALSKIGEFFFDEGPQSPEEKREAVKKYKEKIRINQKSPSNESTAAAANKDAATASVAGPGSSEGRQSTTTGTTDSSGEGELVSTSESVSSRTNEDTTTSEGLESMIPETVCADLSIRSVSTRSVISESATDSGSGNHEQRSLSSQSAGSRKDSSDTAPGDGSMVSDGSNSHERSQQQQQQQPHDKRVLIPIKKGRTRNLYSRFLSNAFRLGARSASTATKTETKTATEPDISPHDRTMAEQLMQYMDSEDEEDGSEDSRSRSLSQDAHSRETSKYDRYSIESKSSESELAVAVISALSQGGFEAGLSQADSGAVTSRETWKSLNTKSTTKSRTVRGWIEDNQDEEEDIGAQIELAIMSSSGETEEQEENKTFSFTGMLKPRSPRSPASRSSTPRSPTRSPLSVLRMTEPNSPENEMSQPSEDIPVTKQRSMKSLFQKKLGKKGPPMQLPILPPIHPVEKETAGGQGDATVETTKVTLQSIPEQKSVSSRSRSLPTNSSGGMYVDTPKMNNSKKVSKLFTQNLTLDSASGKSGTLSEQMQMKSTSVSNADTEFDSVPTKMTTVMQQTFYLDNSEDKEVKSVSNRSKGTQQSRSVASGLIVSAYSAGTTSMLIQDGTMESGTSDDLAEYIEVTYESMGASKESMDASKASSEAASIAKTLSLEENIPAVASWKEKSKSQAAGFFANRLPRQKKDRAEVPLSPPHSGKHDVPEEGGGAEEHTTREELDPTIISEPVTSVAKSTHKPKPAKKSLASNGFMMAIENLQMGADNDSVQEENHDAHANRQDAQAEDVQKSPRGRLGFLSSKLHRARTNPVKPPKQQPQNQLTEPNEMELCRAVTADVSGRKKWARSFSLQRRRSQVKTAESNITEPVKAPKQHLLTEPNEMELRKAATADVSGRKKWVRSFSLQRRHSQVKKAESNITDGAKGSVPPSRLPLLSERAVKTRGADVTNEHGQSYPLQNNPWQMGHPNYKIHPESDPVDTTYGRGVPPSPTVEELKAILKKKLLEISIAQAEGRLASSQSKEAGTDSLKPKRGLSKIRSGFKGMIRWSGKSKKESQSVDGTDAKADEFHGEQTLRKDLCPPWSTQERHDETLLLQHQMMMQSRSPSWIQTARQGDDRLSGVGNRGRYSSQTRLQRVLGTREKQKKTSHSDSTTNSILDAQDEKLKERLFRILHSLSSFDSDSSGDNSSRDGTLEDDTYDGTLDDTLDGDGTAAYSVRNERVLETLRLLHAVKTKKKKRQQERRRRADCHKNFIDPIIEEIGEAACGLRY